jgi:predicted TIM-barrel fold metal-dependent hydrolase
MRTVTLEEHFSTPEAVKATTHLQSGSRAGWVASMRDKLLDLDKIRIAEMDAAGISVQVLSLVNCNMDKLEPAAATPLVRDANDQLAAAVGKHPDRFAGFAALALQDPKAAAAEFERCVCKLGFKGALVHGTVNGVFLDQPQFTPLFETAQALDVPVYLHPTPPVQPVQEAYYEGLPGSTGFLLSTAAWGWHAELGMHCLRLMVSGLFDRFPKLKIIIGHLGENLPFSIARADQILARGAGHLKRRVADYFHENFYLTTSGYFTVPPLLCALQVTGADRILYSVDYPFSPNTEAQHFLNSLPVSPEDLEKIAHGNADRLLKLCPCKSS